MISCQFVARMLTFEKTYQMKKGILCSLIVFSCLSSCRSEIKQRLKASDALLNDYPDSALFVLKQIDSSNVHRAKNKAYFALLKSAALDKNNIDVTNDSLISLAVSYYSRRPNPYNRMRSYYYQGVVKKNAQNYSAAIVSFEKAAREASHINDLRFLGLIYRNMGNVFNATENTIEAIKYTRLAINAFLDNKDTLYADYAKYSLAVNYLNSGHSWDSCRFLLNEIRRAPLPQIVRNQANLRLAYSFVAKGDSLEKAISIYRFSPKNLFWIIDYGYYALAFAKLGQIDSAQKWVNVGLQLAQSRRQDAALNSLVFRVDSLEGRYREALRKVTEAMAVQDSVTRVLLQQSLSVAQKDYYKHETALQKAQIEKQHLLFFAFGIILLLVLMGLFFLWRSWKKEQETLLKEQMAQMALMQQEIRKGNGSLVGALFMEKIARLCGLSNQYFTTEEIEQKQTYLSQFKRAARELSGSSELFEELENSLNLYCSGVMNKLQDQVPEIKGDNRKIIALFFAGIPDSVVQVIMNRVSIGSLRTLRSRLRQTIKEAQAPDENLFLDLLETEKQPGKKTKNEIKNQ